MEFVSKLLGDSLGWQVRGVRYQQTTIGCLRASVTSKKYNCTRRPDCFPRRFAISWMIGGWLVVKSGKRPQWDIASTCNIPSTCNIHGTKGLLLVEAKAHTKELDDELKGKNLQGNAFANSRRNHIRIGAAFKEANVSLMDQTQPVWSLQRDRCYQMSNRFAWSWRLTELGYSVILVYLGFVNAEEMRRGRNQEPFADHSRWKSCVESHSRPLFPAKVWNNQWPVHDRIFVPRILSCEIPYNAPIEDD